MPWLLFAQPYSEVTVGLVSLYFSDVGFTTLPADSPSNTYWDRRIEVPLVVKQSLFSGASAGGNSDISFGQITLGNNDGGLDGLADYDWDGRLIEVRYSDKENPVLADFAVIFSGAAERVIAGDEVVIEVRDLQLLLDEPYQPNRFLGTGGVEGPAAFKDRRKPRLLGVRRQLSPILLDEANQVWCYSDGPVGGPVEVNDSGVILLPHGDTANYAALIATSINTGHYVSCNALGLIRLKSSPAGPVTIHAEGAKLSGVVAKKFADIAVFVVDAATTLTASDFETGTVSALNTTCPQTLGFWYDGSRELTVKGVLDQLAQSIGVYYGFNDSRKLVLGRLDVPAVTEDFSFIERDLISLNPRPAERRLKSQIVRWGQRDNPLLDQDIAGAVTGATRQGFIEQWRQEKFESASVATASILAREESLDSAFDSSTDAQAEAARIVGLYGPKRFGFEATVPFTSGVLPGITVRITDDRFGLSSGKNFRVLSVERRAVDQELILELWG
jgi:hypothetical protein